MSNNTINPKQLRRLIRQSHRKPSEPTPLSHILINIKTWQSPYYVMKTLKPILLTRSLSREYGKRHKIISMYPYNIEPNFCHSLYGHRTYLIDGEYLTTDPSELPF